MILKSLRNVQIIEYFAISFLSLITIDFIRWQRIELRPFIRCHRIKTPFLHDGCYLGHYALWFFWFFFTIGIFVVAGGVGMMIVQSYGK